MAYLYFLLMILCGVHLDLPQMVPAFVLGIVWEFAKWFWKNIQRLADEGEKQ